MVGKRLSMAAALALAAAPAFAQPSAAPLSLQPAAMRAAAPMDENGNHLDGGSWVPAILFVAIIVGGVLLATGVIGDNHHDRPVSP